MLSTTINMYAHAVNERKVIVVEMVGQMYEGMMWVGVNQYVVTTTVWDAETGTAFSFCLHTTDPNFHTAGSAAPLGETN